MSTLAEAPDVKTSSSYELVPPSYSYLPDAARGVAGAVDAGSYLMIDVDKDDQVKAELVEDISGLASNFLRDVRLLDCNPSSERIEGKSVDQKAALLKTWLSAPNNKHILVIDNFDELTGLGIPEPSEAQNRAAANLADILKNNRVPILALSSVDPELMSANSRAGELLGRFGLVSAFEGSKSGEELVLA